MKRRLVLLIVGCMLVAAGCAKAVSTRADRTQTNAVQNALDSRVASENAETTSDPISAAMESIESSRAQEQMKSQEEQMILMKSTEGVDFDLTKMGKEMVYAMVYQLMTEPKEYEGKVFRISGTYYASFIESTNQHYHYCIIRDALACCTQGIEFIWDDGSHVYTDEFPNEGDIVEVTGTFETYTEGNDGRVYCRLNRSSMVVKSGNAGS